MESYQQGREKRRMDPPKWLINYVIYYILFHAIGKIFEI